MTHTETCGLSEQKKKKHKKDFFLNLWTLWTQEKRHQKYFSICGLCGRKKKISKIFFNLWTLWTKEKRHQIRFSRICGLSGREKTEIMQI